MSSKSTTESTIETKSNEVKASPIQCLMYHLDMKEYVERRTEAWIEVTTFGDNSFRIRYSVCCRWDSGRPHQTILFPPLYGEWAPCDTGKRSCSGLQSGSKCYDRFFPPTLRNTNHCITLHSDNKLSGSLPHVDGLDWISFMNSAPIDSIPSKFLPQAMDSTKDPDFQNRHWLSDLPWMSWKELPKCTEIHAYVPCYRSWLEIQDSKGLVKKSFFSSQEKKRTPFAFLCDDAKQLPPRAWVRVLDHRRHRHDTDIRGIFSYLERIEILVDVEKELESCGSHRLLSILKKMREERLARKRKSDENIETQRKKRLKFDKANASESPTKLEEFKIPATQRHGSSDEEEDNDEETDFECTKDEESDYSYCCEIDDLDFD
jgi:hypothetical protein